jgi:hypothetical protein
MALTLLTAQEDQGPVKLVAVVYLLSFVSHPTHICDSINIISSGALPVNCDANMKYLPLTLIMAGAS